MIYYNRESLFKVLPKGCSSIERFLKETKIFPKNEIISLESDHSIVARIMTISLGEGYELEFETHRKYIDLHLVLSGSEFFQVTDSNNLEVFNQYSLENDVIKYRAKNDDLKKIEETIFSEIILNQNNFVFFFPRDAHRGGVFYKKFHKNESLNANNYFVHKIVFKIENRYFK